MPSNYPLPSEAKRGQLRAELDGMITHLYGLTEAEFTHILSTFPIVSAEVKQAAGRMLVCADGQPHQ